MTSTLLAGSLGRTSTVVSLRSLAAIRMSPVTSSTLTAIGSGVSNLAREGSGAPAARTGGVTVGSLTYRAQPV